MLGMTTALASTVAGRGPRIVLVHGFTQTGRSWEAITAALAADHEVVVVDLPGHGASTPQRADLWETAARLGRAGGRATYVGYSLGARACLHLALDQPTLTDRLVLLGGTAGIDDPAERSERRAADEDLARSIEHDGVDAFLDRWLALPMFAGLPAAQRSGAALAARRANTPAGLAGSLRLAGSATMDPPLWDRLCTLHLPTLVLAGERDDKFTALGRRLAAGIGGPAQFATVPGAGHAAHLEQPDEFLAILRRWLDDTKAGRA